MLYLTDKELDGTIPAALGGLVELERLDLDDNRLTGPIPPDLGNMSGLEQLILAHNRLSGEIPAELGSLSGLTELWLRNNGLSGCIPSGMRSVGASDLGRLGFSYCALPKAPGNLSATAAHDSGSLSWDAPAGSTVTGCRICADAPTTARWTCRCTWRTPAASRPPTPTPTYPPASDTSMASRPSTPKAWGRTPSPLPLPRRDGSSGETGSRPRSFGALRRGSQVMSDVRSELLSEHSQYGTPRPPGVRETLAGWKSRRVLICCPSALFP